MFDVWKTNDSSEITVDGNGCRKVKVAIYCRVSTEHDAQVKALENQIKWFNSILPNHPNWELVDTSCSAQSKRNNNSNTLTQINGYYIDEGLSGLSTENRPALRKLLADSKQGKIDLILTREVCRFSRNILDAISLTRDLRSREYGVAIYFFNDNIFSYASDCELRLGLYSTFAQSESQKISERVRAGQKTSRDKGVLYGNGNIMGYDLHINKNGSNCYVINTEQAKTVRRIFELCLEGIGITKIGNALVKEGRVSSCGNLKWCYQTVLRILQNKVYCGYIRSNVTISDDCLEKKRHNTNKSEMSYLKVNEDIIPPIIDEDIFNECQKLLQKRGKAFKTAKTSSGKQTSAKDVFAKKLRCSCGHSFRKNIWYTKRNGEKTYGYTCYNVLNNGKISNYSNPEDIEKYNICNMQAISGAHLKIQAFKVFNGLIEDKTLIDDAIVKSRRKFAKSKKNVNSIIESKKSEIEKIKNRTAKYIDMLADDVISKEEYLDKKNNNEIKINNLESEIIELENELNEEVKPSIDEAQLKETLSEIMDCTTDIDERIIDMFVYRIIVKSPTHFVWQLHFKAIENEEPEFTDLCPYLIDFDFAKTYSVKHNNRIYKSSWKDITVDVQIAI